MTVKSCKNYYFIWKSFLVTTCIALAGATGICAASGSMEPPRAIATFECVGLYWKAPSGECEVAYRREGAERWREAMPLWFDEAAKEHRGSIVGLQDGVSYEIKLMLEDAKPVTLTATTRDNKLPVARLVKLPSGVRSDPLIITEGGDSEKGYVLYEASDDGTTIDVKGESPACITVKADYVIIRGVTCINGERHGVLIGQDRHHVVIDGCDISQWGRKAVDVFGERDHGICSLDGSHHLIVQRSKIYNPNYGTASWAEENPVHIARHPKSNPYHTYGPNAIGFNPGPGNNIIRWNDVYSTNGNYFEDGFGVPRNGHPIGFPGVDSDIYGNRIQNCHDEAIECDGSDRNVRVFGNYISDVIKGIVATPAREGPIYIYRNVMGLCRKDVGQDGVGFIGNGNKGKRAGKVYIFHNTMLPAGPERARVGIWGGYQSGPMHITSRNNIWHCVETPYASTVVPPHASNSYDYDMTSIPHDAYLHPPSEESLKRPPNVGHDNRKAFPRGKRHFPEGAQKNGITSVAKYQPGHGWDNGVGSGEYQLAEGSPGVDQAQRLPNFNDDYTGNGPDIGTHERDTPSMKFGVAAAPENLDSEQDAANGG